MISVVIPCHNSEDFVSRAIDSVFNQSYSKWELILVNNNSTDGTQSILDKYKNQYPDKITVLDQKKIGAPAARNLGLNSSKGDWIQFLDADDELLIDKLESNMKIAETNLADVIIGGFYVQRTNDPLDYKDVRTPDLTNIWKSHISSNLGVTSANLWRKSALTDVEGWDEKLTSSQEYDLLFRLMVNKSRLVLDKAVLTILHVNNDSISKSTDSVKLERILNNIVNLRLRVKQYLTDNEMFTKELSDHMDVFLFNHLMNKKSLAPKVVNKMLKELKLDVPFYLKLKLNIRHFIYFKLLRK